MAMHGIHGARRIVHDDHLAFLARIFEGNGFVISTASARLRRGGGRSGHPSGTNSIRVEAGIRLSSWHHSRWALSSPNALSEEPGTMRNAPFRRFQH